MMTIDGRDDVPQETAHHENAVDDYEIVPPAGVSATDQIQAADAVAAEAALLAPEPSISPSSSREFCALRRDTGFIELSTTTAPEQHSTRHGIRWSRRLSARATSEAMLTREKINANRANIIRHIVLQACTDSIKDFAFKISVNAALRKRDDEARLVILVEFK
jgi:hypothetical protein